MSTVTLPEPASAEPARLLDRPYRLNVAQYERMIEAGIFGDRDKVFLWKGRLVEPMTKHYPHSFAVSTLYDLLNSMQPGAWHCMQEQPLPLSDDSMPEPDVSVVRGARRDYRRGRATPRDVPLVIEVADSSLAFDRGEKLRAYAAQAVPVYWVVDIPGRRVEVYSDPTGPADIPAYRSCRQFGESEVIPVVLDGLEVTRLAVADIFLDPDPEPTPPA